MTPRYRHRPHSMVADGRGATKGQAVIMTGRRRVGKSRLVQEFCDRSELPYVVFQATDWNQALRSPAHALPDDSPSIAVIDELPWLVEQDREFEGALQTVWDRHLSAKPVLLVLVGSDMSVMEALQSYGRPFFGRAAKMTVHPLHLADVQAMTRLEAADAVDALLITGGFPEIVQSWQPGMSCADFLEDAVSHPLSPLLVAGELSLLGEFPEASHSRSVLEAIGSGERTFSAIAAQSGGSGALPSGTPSPLLNTLQAAIPLVERGRGDVALARIEKSWTTWRGRTVEPVVREALARLLPDDAWLETEAVGGWWNRQNNPEVDLIGADPEPTAAKVHFVGSVKWLENQPFGRREYDSLAQDVLAVPGAEPDTPLVAVSRSGAEDALPLAAHWGPEDLVRAWR